jgi:hypothetical protein
VCRDDQALVCRDADRIDSVRMRRLRIRRREYQLRRWIDKRCAFRGSDGGSDERVGRHRHEPDVVGSRCDLLRGLGRLVGKRGDERHAVHERTHREHDLHTHLHWVRRFDGAERDRVGHDGILRPDGEFKRGIDERDERWQHEFELDGEQRDLLHGLGRLERERGDERYADDGRAHLEHDVHARLHGSGRYDESERDGAGELAGDDGGKLVLGDERESFAQCEGDSHDGYFAALGIFRCDGDDGLLGTDERDAGCGVQVELWRYRRLG